MEVGAMSKLSKLYAKRGHVAKSIGEIHRMRKGSLNSFRQKVVHQDGEVVMKGPYYTLTKKVSGGKTITQSIPASDVPRIRQEVENYKKFRSLADEYIEVCEGIALLESGDGDAKKN
jgi:hypothetical protein